jgi:hypothetical protein
MNPDPIFANSRELVSFIDLFSDLRGARFTFYASRSSSRAFDPPVQEQIAEEENINVLSAILRSSPRPKAGSAERRTTEYADEGETKVPPPTLGLPG